MINVTGTVARQRTVVLLIRMQVRFERLLVKKAVTLLSRQGKQAAKVYKATGDKGAALAVVSASIPEWNDVMQKHLFRVGEHFGNEILEGFQKSDSHVLNVKDSQNVFLDAMLKWTREQGVRDVTRITQTTKELLQSAILSGQQEGEGQDLIAKRITDKIVGAGKLTAQARARTIARTETHNALTFAGDEAASSTGLTLEREWLTTDDERARPTHTEADGQRRGMDEMFDVGNDKLMRPGDPSGSLEEIINCRCGVIYHTV